MPRVDVLLCRNSLSAACQVQIGPALRTGPISGPELLRSYLRTYIFGFACLMDDAWPLSVAWASILSPALKVPSS
jgi:hypothetical protein